MAQACLDTALGIDLGTTSVKVSLVDLHSRNLLYVTSRATAARVAGVEDPPKADEQDVRKILGTVAACLVSLQELWIANNVSHKIRRIGVTGQMHGVVLWKSGLRIDDFLSPSDSESDNASDHGGVGVSHLFTWQDGRCSTEFLASLPPPDSHLKLSTGHGCATLFWLQRHRPEVLREFNCAGTVMDLFVTLLCDLNSPVMSVQNAASWGYFSCTKGSWNTDILAEAGFPTQLLPTVKTPGTVAGKTKETKCFGGLLPEGVAVGVGLGDLPCNMIPILESSDCGALSISTSAQVVTTTPPSFTPPPSDPTSPVEYFPYFGGTYLAVAAALTGGNVLAWLVETIQRWLQSTGLGVSAQKDKLFERLIELGLQCGDTSLEISPILGGERHQPDRRGTAANICFDNVSLGSVFRATCRGVARNLSEMAPPDTIREKGVARMVGCGSALLRNPVLKEEVEAAFEGLSFVYSDRGDASIGAALAELD
ncbi:sedoheptulokinase-like [Diadema antillarum]|uniref:sedoheptulokinase-like n=1 Tax=Diadema antillarum TaxID=105358 RepID=UPI003A8787E1